MERQWHVELLPLTPIILQTVVSFPSLMLFFHQPDPNKVQCATMLGNVRPDIDHPI
jgi:hypothetical protein